MKRLLYIARYPALVVLLLLLLALAPAMAQNVVRQGDITDLGIEQKPGDTYIWELYNDSTINFAQVAGTAVADGDAAFVSGNTGPDVQVEWKKPGTYFYKVTGVNASGCTNNLRIGVMKVHEALPTAIITPPVIICAGEPVSLEINFTGTGPWSFTYSATDINGITSSPVSITDVTVTPFTLIIDPGPAITNDYQIKSITDQNGTNLAGSNTVTQEVNPLPKPSTIYHR